MKKYIIIFMFTVFNTVYCQEYFSATIKYISDGDTIVTNEYGRIRLQCVDTPELHYKNKAQACENNSNAGSLSKNYLETLLDIKKPIKLVCDTKNDKYNRLLCYVYQNDKNINEILLVNGYAFADKRYCRSDEIELFNNAKNLKRGLFMGCNPEDPALFRKVNGAGMRFIKMPREKIN